MLTYVAIFYKFLISLNNVYKPKPPIAILEINIILGIINHLFISLFESDLCIKLFKSFIKNTQINEETTSINKLSMINSILYKSFFLAL